MALWPRPRPPQGNTPKGGGVLAFMALASSPIGGNPSPLGMGSWPYGLGLILPPQGGWRLGLHGLGVISHRGKWRVACGMWRDLWRVYNLLYFYLIFLLSFSLFLSCYLIFFCSRSSSSLGTLTEGKVDGGVAARRKPLREGGSDCQAQNGPRY